ncbi:hypothetical protein ABZT03_39940 [Streptomyces sp. NPDC005574]|uniref:hypothetical protein n=1 Tax=Streptomyces sp. NPDC005574 TaxID=3156891 RepID=UPI0033B6E808
MGEFQAEAERILAELGVAEALSERRRIARVELVEALAADNGFDPAAALSVRRGGTTRPAALVDAN